MKSQGKSGKKIIIAVAVAAVIAVIAFLLSLRGVEDFHEKYAGADLSTDVEGMQRTGTYTGYLNDHADAAHPDQNVAVDLYSYESDGTVEVYNDYEGAEKALFTDTNSKVTWEIDRKQIMSGRMGAGLVYCNHSEGGRSAWNGQRQSGRQSVILKIILQKKLQCMMWQRTSIFPRFIFIRDLASCAGIL